MKSWFDKASKLLPDRNDNQNTRFFKLMIYVSTGILLFMIISSSAAFLIVLRGAEEVMVPNITGMKLEEALISLQDRGLNSRVQLKYSSSPADKGNILEQEPNPGAIRKAGSIITLRVSRGAIIDTIENYQGWRIDDLEIHLRTLFTTYGPLLRIKEPVVRIFDESPAGTILEQKPEPGSALSELTELELIVSRGPEGGTFVMPIFEGLQFKEALLKAAGFNLPFIFISREPGRNEQKGVVVSQTPPHEQHVPVSTILQLTITPPEPVTNRVFGILERTLPEYPVSVDLKLERITAEGIRNTIFTTRHKGGVIAIPYFEEDGTRLILSAMEKELLFFTVKK